ncbi:MAG: hypothetical protein L6Q54_03990 [Leptospiraceae bacterium]|nr:PD40 domain-containing protein [Leptospiraceae bacterium]MCK6380395.1 hypothetical protein [Leptospiraceae bacterium]NUM40563.1 PD40 domain-containing protein [Leptospiraceae bacterium]
MNFQHLGKLVIVFFSFSFFQCALFQKSVKIKPLNFEYSSISKNYFTPSNEKPFPLTVHRGHNLYNSTTFDGNFLFFTTDQEGNNDIWFRDLKSSVVSLVTRHPSHEYKPAISPDGKTLAYVTEEFDSEGDIAILKINPSKWVSEIAKGNQPEVSDYQVITNPDYIKSSGKERLVDTDPAFSPDSRFLVFSSERFSPGKQNLVLADLKKKNEMKPLTKEGGASPFWSFDGKKIVFLSFKDDPNGEIYFYDLSTGKEERLTNDSYMDFSPSLSIDGKYLFYTSIRKDTNKNGKLDERDNSYIVRVNLENKIEKLFSSGKTSVFDTKYSNFNGGSILFSESLHNSINIYFIPASGSVPKQDTIDSQMEYSLRYRKKHSYESFLLALDSVELFFGEDKLFPIYNSKIELIKVQESKKSGNSKFADEILKKMEKTKLDPNHALSHALYISYKSEEENKNQLPLLKKYFQQVRNTPSINRNVSGAILNHIGDVELKTQDTTSAIQTYRELLASYPEYFLSKEIKQKIGALEFQSTSTILPKEYIEIMNDPISKKEDISILEKDIENKISQNRTPDEKIQITEKIITENKLPTVSAMMDALMLYIKALALNEAKKFSESNTLVDSYLNKVPVARPLFLKSHLLKSKNFESLGSVSGSFDELRLYLENYDPALGVELKEAEIEKSFRYYENKAIEHEKIGNLREAALHYFYNTENMFLLKSKNLFLDTLYRDYAIYYQRRMVESIFRYGEKLADDKRKSILSKINLLGEGGVNVVGNVTGALSKVTDVKGVKNLKVLGDFRDLQGIEVLGDEATKLIELHFKQGLPRARPHLYLASLYGYAYYLINKGVIYENAYYSAGAMTKARKASILEDFKKAEYELKWIIFADPMFTDAYQLLGWLYQYIDIVRSSKNSDEESTEEELFQAQYEKFFPGKHFEENIELYRQILNFLGNSPNKKVLSDLNLNLANNYFLLSNYPRAKEHYDITKKMEKFIVSKTQFENYKQKALFHFNFGRTLIYLSDFENALVELKEATSTYYKNEYYIAYSKAKTLTQESNELTNPLNEAKRKLSLLFALTGLAAMESLEYSQAIGYYKKALAMNREIHYLENSSLYNAIAICYQKRKEFKNSDRYAKLAEKATIQNKKGTFKKLTSFSVWNILMPDSVRVIGDGRFPGAFPPEYHNLLAKGIMIENSLERNEFSKASKLFEKRKKFIQANDLIKSVAGKRILNFTEPMLATSNYLKGDYFTSYKKFLESFRLRKKEGNTEEARRFLRDSSVSLLETITRESDIDSKMSLLNEFIEIYLNERKEYFNECSERIDTDGLVKSELEKEEFCEDNFYKEWNNYEPLLGVLYFYKGEFLQSQGESLKANYYFGLSFPYLKNPSQIEMSMIGLSGDPFSKKERTRILINLIKLYRKLGDKENFRTNLQFAGELASNGNFLEEMIYLKILESEFIYNENTTKQSFDDALRKVLEAESIIGNNPELVLTLNNKIFEDIHILKNKIYLAQKKYSEMFESKDRIIKLNFFKSVLLSNLNFESADLSKMYSELQGLFEESSFLEQKIQTNWTDKKSVETYTNRKAKVREKIFTKLKQIQTSFPEKAHFFDPAMTFNPIPKPSGRELILRFIDIGNNLLINKISKEENSFTNLEKKDGNLKKTIEDFLTKIQNDIQKSTTTIIIPDSNTFVLNFSQMKIGEKLLGEVLKVRYAFLSSQLDNNAKKMRSGQTKRAFAILGDKEIQPALNKSESYMIFKKSSLGSDSYVPDTLDGSLDFSYTRNYFGESIPGYINLKEIFEKNTRISKVLVNNFKFAKRNFEKLAFSSEVFRSSGVGDIFYVSEGNDNTAIRKKILQNENFINELSLISLVGSKIFNKEESINKNDYDRFLKTGIELEKKGKLSEALIQYESALYSLDKKYEKEILDSEILVSSTKVKIYREESSFKHFDKLIEKYKEDAEKLNLVLYSRVKSCFLGLVKFDCKKFDQEFQDKVSENTNSTNSKYIKNIGFFRNIYSGKLIDFDKNLSDYLQNNSKDNNPFLYSELRKILQKNLIDNPDRETNLSNSIGINSELEDSNISKIEKVFLYGKNPVTMNLKDDGSAYYYAVKKEWDKFDTKVQQLYNDENTFSESVVRDYKRDILKTFKKLSVGRDFIPLFLSPEELENGKSTLYYINSIDRSLLFYILTESIPGQLSGEINSLFDKILQTENELGNLSKAQLMMIVWAECLLEKGDNSGAKKYIEKVQKETSIHNSTQEKFLRFLYLKFRYSLLNKDLKFLDEETAFLKLKLPEKYSFYETAQKTEVKKLVEYLNSVIEKKSKNTIETFSKRELIQLVTYLQHLSFKANNSEVFFDLGLAKDKIRGWNERIIGQNSNFGKLPRFKTVSYELFKALPKNQTLLSVFDFGLQTFSIKFYNGKSNGELAFKDNRPVYDSLTDYYRNLQENGNAILQKEAIEERYRKSIKLDKNRLTYLYLSSYHFKAPLEYREDDNFYLVTDPGELLNRTAHNISEDISPNFSLEKKKNTNFSKDWFLKLKRLENLEAETVTGKKFDSKVILSQEEILLKDNKEIYYGGSPLLDIERFGKRTGNWFLSSSYLHETSFYSDDINATLQFINKIHYGPGVFSIGSQKDLSNVYFLKNLFLRSRIKKSLKERFIDAISEVKKNYPDEIHWNGYRLYTSTLLVE